VVGGGVPADVELESVPADWGPSLTKYRYVYSGDRVILVDPGMTDDSTNPATGYGANGRRATEDATTEKPTSTGGCSPHRERKNYAAQFPAEAASSAKALDARFNQFERI